MYMYVILMVIIKLSTLPTFTHSTPIDNLISISTNFIEVNHIPPTSNQSIRRHQYTRKKSKKMSIKGRPSIDEYQKLRADWLNREFSDSFESDVELTVDEQRVNEIIMELKRIELEAGLKDPRKFIPSRHFFESVQTINQSKLFEVIKLMPKGGILHAHDTAICSTDYVVSLTYWEHLWQCHRNGSDFLDFDQIVEFKFSTKEPNRTKDDCTWHRVEDIRKMLGNSTYDKELRSIFTLYSTDPEVYSGDINKLWSRFMQIFILVEPIFTYEPVWRDYYRQTLQEVRNDNVQYLEFRGLLPSVYDLTGKIYSQIEVAGIYVDVLKEFLNSHSDFIGSKFIFAPLKLVSDQTVDEYLKTVKILHETYPDFIAGFDLVGQEDLGRPLVEFADQLLQLPDEIQFFFHAGETNWFGSVDENLIDAVLLGTRRIGHGFALTKHPALLDRIKSSNIAVEVNPISNQVLRLVDDYRNHPASTYFARNIPMVISSDDPSFFESSPLSHDFYMAFLGISSAGSDLRTLKKLILNSIRYSAMSKREQEVALAKWAVKWEDFIRKILELYGNK